MPPEGIIIQNWPFLSGGRIRAGSPQAYSSDTRQDRGRGPYRGTPVGTSGRCARYPRKGTVGQKSGSVSDPTPGVAELVATSSPCREAEPDAMNRSPTYDASCKGSLHGPVIGSDRVWIVFAIFSLHGRRDERDLPSPPLTGTVRGRRSCRPLVSARVLRCSPSDTHSGRCWDSAAHRIRAQLGGPPNADGQRPGDMTSAGPYPLGALGGRARSFRREVRIFAKRSHNPITADDGPWQASCSSRRTSATGSSRRAGLPGGKKWHRAQLRRASDPETDPDFCDGTFPPDTLAHRPAVPTGVPAYGHGPVLPGVARIRLGEPA